MRGASARSRDCDDDHQGREREFRCVVRLWHCDFRHCEPKAKQSRSRNNRLVSLRPLLHLTIQTAPYLFLDCFALLAMTVFVPMADRDVGPANRDRLAAMNARYPSGLCNNSRMIARQAAAWLHRCLECSVRIF
jgi:hypothetical protein